MNREMRKRYVIRTWAEIAAIGGIYLLVILLTPLRIPCPIRFLTGFQCPGCGVTHMLTAFSRLDLGAAREANAFVFYTSPVILFEILLAAYLYLKNKKMPRWNEAFLAVFCILLLAFGVYRNFAGC